MAVDQAGAAAKFVGGLMYGLGFEASKFVAPAIIGMVPKDMIKTYDRGPLYMVGMCAAGIAAAAILSPTSPMWGGAALAGSIAIGAIKMINS